MDNDRFFNSFHVTPPFTSNASSANAVNNDSRRNRSKHSHLEASNFQENIVLVKEKGISDRIPKMLSLH
jgi:hypothetical protein